MVKFVIYLLYNLLKKLVRFLLSKIGILFLMLFSAYCFCARYWRFDIVLVEGTLNTGISSVTYELCPTSSVSLNIVIENFRATADTVSKVTLMITGVNSLAKAEYTISIQLTCRK